MLQRVVPVGLSLVRDSLMFDVATNSVWAASAQGGVVSVRLLDDRVDAVGFGYRRPIAAMALHDGLTVVVVERRGRVWHARRDQASRNQARLVVDLPSKALVARRHPDAGQVLALVTGRLDGDEPGPTLLTCNLDDGTVRAVASGLGGAQTFVVDDARREVVVSTEEPDGTRTLLIIGLDDGAVTEVSGVPAFDTLVTSPDPAEHAVVGASAEQAALGRLTLIRDDGTAGTTVDLGRRVKGLTRWGSLVLATSGTDLVALEWDLDPGTLPITTPLGPLYVNGYVSLLVDVSSAGLALEDVTFSVREGTDAGTVSAGIEPPTDDGRQPVRLVAGFIPGEYHVEARRVADGAVLATRRFRVTSCWPDADTGPPVSLTGGHQLFSLMNWGGAGGSGGYLLPAPELWRVAVVLVSTKDRRWDRLEGAAKDAWKERVIGTGTSVKTFYEEVSYRNTPGPPGASPGMTAELVGGRVFGPVDLDEGWGDVFEPKDAGDVNAGWLTKPTGRQVLAGAISAHLADQPEGAQLLELADCIAIVVRSGSDKPTPMGTAPPLPTRYSWGHASNSDFWRKTATTFTQGPKPVTIMTEAYPAGLANQPILTHTLCHEIGHNLGLADLYDARGDYPAEINARSPSRVDLMASSKPLPHFSLANRIRLGWVDRSWLRRFDFSASPVGGPVTLQATERLTRGGPAAGHAAGIEVPISDGWSYLFEFRREQDGQVGDQQLQLVSGTRRFVLGTDLRVSGGESARPPVLFLPEDVDGDGPVLDAGGENYRDSDVTNPERMHDFALTLQQIGVPSDDSAKMEVTYVAAHRPQLRVRPAPGRGDFKSPDIELIGPFGASVPGIRKGMPNAIKVTVHNLGSLAATEVQVHVKWLPFTVSAGSWKSLPDPTPFTVPASGTSSFVVPWDVPASVKVGDTEAEHFCVRVDIDRYKDPAHPEQEEIVTFDNWAQSNFDSTTVAFGSPSDRVRTVATASNSLDRAATYQFTADQSSDWYRIYLGHAWLRLTPGETRAFELGYESLAGDQVYGESFDQNIERITSQDDHVAVTSWIVPENTECDTAREWWGVGLDLRAGVRAWIEDVRSEGELVTARVFGRSNGATFGLSGGEFHLAAWPEEAPERVSHTEGTIDEDGIGRVLLSNESLRDISDGRRVIASVARPGGGGFALAVTPPEPLS